MWMSITLHITPRKTTQKIFTTIGQIVVKVSYASYKQFLLHLFSTEFGHSYERQQQHSMKKTNIYTLQVTHSVRCFAKCQCQEIHFALNHM